MGLLGTTIFIASIHNPIRLHLPSCSHGRTICISIDSLNVSFIHPFLWLSIPYVNIFSSIWYIIINLFNHSCIRQIIHPVMHLFIYTFIYPLRNMGLAAILPLDNNIQFHKKLGQLTFIQEKNRTFNNLITLQQKRITNCTFISIFLYSALYYSLKWQIRETFFAKVMNRKAVWYLFLSFFIVRDLFRLKKYRNKENYFFILTNFLPSKYNGSWYVRRLYNV